MGFLSICCIYTVFLCVNSHFNYEMPTQRNQNILGFPKLHRQYGI